MNRFALALLLFLSALADAAPNPPLLVLATSAATAADLLPARVMLLSAKANGQLPPDVVLMLLTTSRVPAREADRVADADGIVHTRLAHPHASPSFLPLFDLNAHKVLYISPYTLVTDSLAPLFRCPSFCAAFDTPCSFSTSLMVLTPNQTTHAALTHLSENLHLQSSPCHNPPDWLTPQACVLNHHLGKQLITAPVFNPNQLPERPANLSEASPMLRLPVGCHVPNFLYYPRFQWEVPQVPCGRRRAIKFDSPPFLRPWYWWSYLLMDLSWQWRSHRIQLDDRHIVRTERLEFINRICLLVLMCSAAVFAATNARDLSEWRQLKSDSKRKYSALPEPVLVLYVISAGATACALSWALAFFVTPPTLALSLALPLVAAYHTATTAVLWVGLGTAFIKNHTIPADARCPKSERRAALETMGMAVFEMAYVTFVLLVANFLPAETIYARLLWLAIGAGSYICLVLWMLGRLCTIWVAVGAKEWLS